MFEEIAFLTGFLTAVVIGRYVIKITLKGYELDERGFRGAGATIGMIERALIYILAYLGEYTAISFILAAKSISRFNDLKERKFAEYYLIGSLMSILFAVVVVLGVKWSIKYF